MNILNYIKTLYDKEGAAENFRKSLAVLYHCYKDSDIEKLNPDYLLDSKQTEITDSLVDEIGELDYRVKELRMSNFRKFPSPKDKDSAYGIVMSIDDNPCSVYLTGNNGTGKSSVYSAIEYAFRGKVKERTNKELKYGFGRNSHTDGAMSVILQTCGSKFDGSKVNPFPKSMFCDEKELAYFSSQYSLIEYAMTNIGYGDLLQLEISLSNLLKDLDQRIEEFKAMQKISEYVAEDENFIIDQLMVIINQPNHRKKNADTIEICSQIEKSIEDYLSGLSEDNAQLKYMSMQTSLSGYKQRLQEESCHKTLKKRRKELGALIKTDASLSDWQIEDFPLTKEEVEVYSPSKKLLELLTTVEGLTKGKNEKELYESVKKYIVDSENRKTKREQFPIDEQITNILIDFKSAFIVLLNEIKITKQTIIQELVNDYLPFCADLLKSFSPQEDTIVFEKRENDIEVSIHTEKCLPDGSTDSFVSSPWEYYNTFRLKLFIVSLKVSFLFAYMKRNKCNLPLILDDVFSASDFDNSNKLERFVASIYKEYKRIFGEDKMQIIMLSHDSVIQDAFKNGSAYINQQNALIKIPYVVGRLFNYECSEDIKKACKETKFEPLCLTI